MPVSGLSGMAKPTSLLNTASGSISLYIAELAASHDTLRLLAQGLPSQKLVVVDRPSCSDGIGVAVPRNLAMRWSTDVRFIAVLGSRQASQAAGWRPWLGSTLALPLSLKDEPFSRL